MNKYSRICWNSLNWTKPCGEAQFLETDGAHVQRTGFGHEEWLFRFDWLLEGYNNSSTPYRYGFLQPFEKYMDTYSGRAFDVLLYTVNPDKKRLLVAKIKDLLVPTKEELHWAFEQMVSKGWLDVMINELDDLDIDTKYLQNSVFTGVINVRFRPEDVTFFAPQPEVIGQHKIISNSRYHPFDWNDGFPPIIYPTAFSNTQIDESDFHLPSDDDVHRSAVDSLTYKRRHVHIQKKIFAYLKTVYPSCAVSFEDNYVDLTVSGNDGTFFFEIKTKSTAKLCIREAFGQILEYAYYPGKSFADELIIVGEGEPLREDIQYLKFLRDKFSVPIYYSRWDDSQLRLEEKV